METRKDERPADDSATRGSASRWGPLFGAQAQGWSQTWESTQGWGGPAYEHVLDRTGVVAETHVLDCGCGAGRFARLAADRGARVGRN